MRHMLSRLFKSCCSAAAVAAATLLLFPKPAFTGGDQSTKVKKELFQTSDRCFACHNGLTNASGEDISIGFDWRASMMANSSRDPYWQGSVRRETIDHPESTKAVEDECSICHMPMARFQAKATGHEGEVFSHIPFDKDKPADRLAEDGVSCSLCHQITNEKLGTRESFVGGFVVDTTKPLGERAEYGPFKIENGQNRIMRTSSGGFRPTEGTHIRKSEVCATCHTLYTRALGANGQAVGELPEQMPYLEWLQSDFKDKQSCQSCHMPTVKEPVAVTKVLGVPREGMSRHEFLGGNFFMLKMLNRYRNDLSVAALPEELESSAARTSDYLRSEAADVSIPRVEVQSNVLEADVVVQNLGGHKLPTAYPSRRAWLHVTVRDRDRRVVFESGAINAQGAILGNDNDADAARYEPHYSRITSPEQVQIYEAIMVDTTGAVTTGLLSAVGYVKDNRLLPRGFNKATADKDIKVQGTAADDPDFVGGEDRVHYSVALNGSSGPYQVQAELWYQPISFRWASNLGKYDKEEPRRFIKYYESMSSGSAILLCRAVASK